jgi:predicted dehydrogenase
MIRVGIVGSGGIAKRHVEYLGKFSDEAKVTAAVDLSEDRTAWLTEKTGAKFCGDIDTALDLIDAAYVTTPPRSRIDLIQKLANAGKAIFCEKPMAGTVEDAQTIVDIAEKSGVPFMTGFMRRFHEPYGKLKALADSKELGRPLQFFRRRNGLLQLPEGNWRNTQGQLTGFTIESVSHDIDLLRWLGGEIVEASGEVLESHPEVPGFDDMCVATLRFANGAVGVLQIAWASLISENAVGVMGTERSALIDGNGMWRSDRIVTRSAKDAEPQIDTFPEDQIIEDGYYGQTKTFLALARGEKIPHPGARDGLATLQISHKILASSHGR